VFASYTGTRSVRIRPHLITTRADIDEALAAFSAAAADMT
jgi:4-aminobutyrate aminotransferase/(S)-3-amino-2-methylpropionate transaminase